MKTLFGLIFISVLLYSNELFKALPEVNIKNSEKIDLGKELFYDPILSKNKDISCFNCHHTYGADNKKFSIGDQGKEGMINTPSVFNLPFKKRYFWNGRSETLEKQLIDGPLFNPHEMANDKETIENRLKASQKYQELFKKAYDKTPSFKLMLDALVKFQETLISTNSKFDKYLKGELELSQKEKKGLSLFITYGCVSCHNGIIFGGNSFQKFGSVIQKDEAKGAWEDRYSVTKNEKDKMVFLVPSLRNIDKTAPYFHSGDIWDLKDAIKLMSYYNVGVVLDDKEIEEIEEFLKTLTGEIPKTLEKDQ